jgi:hypothetical protein
MAVFVTTLDYGDIDETTYVFGERLRGLSYDVGDPTEEHVVVLGYVWSAHDGENHDSCLKAADCTMGTTTLDFQTPVSFSFDNTRYPFHEMQNGVAAQDRKSVV